MEDEWSAYRVLEHLETATGQLLLRGIFNGKWIAVIVAGREAQKLRNICALPPVLYQSGHWVDNLVTRMARVVEWRKHRVNALIYLRHGDQNDSLELSVLDLLGAPFLATASRWRGISITHYIRTTDSGLFLRTDVAGKESELWVENDQAVEAISAAFKLSLPKLSTSGWQPIEHSPIASIDSVKPGETNALSMVFPNGNLVKNISCSVSNL